MSRELPAPEGEADWLALAQRFLVQSYRPSPIVLARGEGSLVFDGQGRSYLDFSAGVAVTSLGHCHPRLSAAIAAQSARLVHVSNYFYNEENVLLARELCQATGYRRAFFCNSGAEANEAMLKAARRHFFAKGEPDRTRVIAFQGAFHGRTLATLALGGNPTYLEGFGSPLGGVTHVAYGDLAAAAESMGPDVCAVIVEPIQGEGGVVVPPDGFLRGLRALTEEHGALLLLDEVQTGVARTGAFLAADHEGVRADGVALAKGLGGGFPIGALLVGERLEGALVPGSHGSTFGGNPLASAAARAVLAVVHEEGLARAAEDRGRVLRQRLEETCARFPAVCEGVRGKGLLLGVVLREGLDAGALLRDLAQGGLLLTLAGGRVLRFTPPLTVSEDDLERAQRHLESTLARRAS